MPVNAKMARRGVSSRLWLATAAVAVTFGCVVAVVVGAQTQFGVAALLGVAFCAFNAAVALLMSARREESVHRLATELSDRPLLETDGADGAP